MAHREPGDPRCKDCADPHEPSASRCAACAARHRLDAAERARKRLVAKRCIVCGQPAAKDRLRTKKKQKLTRYCATHLDYYAERAGR
jgi:hypothetical protein